MASDGSGMGKLLVLVCKVILVPRLFGVFPLKESQGEFVAGWFHLIHFSINLLFFTTGLILYYFDNRAFDTVDKWSQSLIIIQVIFQYLFIVVSFISVLFYRQFLNRSLHEMSSVEEELGKSNINIDYNIKCKLFIISFFVFLVMSALRFSRIFYLSAGPIVTMISLYGLSFLTCLLAFEIASLLSLPRSFIFQLVNSLRYVVSKSKKRWKISKVKELADMQFRLCLVCEDLNEIFGLPVLIFSIMILNTYVCNSKLIITHFKSPKLTSGVQWKDTLIKLCSMTTQGLCLWNLVDVCYISMKEPIRVYLPCYTFLRSFFLTEMRLSEALSRVFSLPRLVGMCPFMTFSDDIIISKPIFILGLASCILFLINIGLLCFVPQNMLMNMAPLDEIMVISQLIGGYIGVILAFVIPVLFIDKYRSILNFLRLSEKEISKYSIGLYYNYKRVYSFLGFTVFFFMSVIRFLTYREYNFDNMFKFFSIYWMQFLIGISVYLICGNLSLINSQLSVTRSSLLWIGHGPRYPGRVSRLEAITNAQCKIYLACGGFNQLFSAQILVFVVCTLNQLVGSLKIVLTVALKSYKNIDDYFTMTVKICSTSYFFVNLLSIVSICSSITAEVKEFNSLLFQLMIDDKTKELSKNETLRLHVSLNREVVFTACGLFTLDYTLVHSMIAAATTYLVILIQFSNDSPQSVQLDGTPPTAAATWPAVNITRA